MAEHVIDHGPPLLVWAGWGVAAGLSAPWQVWHIVTPTLGVLAAAVQARTMAAP